MAHRVFQVAGIEDNDGSLFRRFFHFFNDFERWCVYPDVVPFLGRAREAGVRVALISNAGTGLTEHLRVLGLDRFLDHVTISAAEGSQARPKDLRSTWRRSASSPLMRSTSATSTSRTCWARGRWGSRAC
jgi:FMN phosphatase YigB (HAD superfamily)